MVSNWIEKIKLYRDDIFWVVLTALFVITLVGGVRFEALKKEAPLIRIEKEAFSIPVKSENTTFLYVASKNGTKFYPLGCKAAERIKQENRIYFASVLEAEQAGFERTSTCP